MTGLNRLAADLFELDQPLGPFRHRMTVVRLPEGGGLWIHSPVEWTPELWAELEGLAPPDEPRHLVIPSRTHDLYLDGWRERIPAATTYAPPALQKAHPDWGIEHTLTPEFHASWSAILPHVCLMGAARVSEVAFLHAPTRTLILVDSLFNHHAAGKPWLTRLVLWLDGASRGVAFTRLFKFLVKDKPAFRASLAEVLAWDFERVLVGHGELIEGPAVDEARRLLAAY